jgi:hypothetical protein
MPLPFKLGYLKDDGRQAEVAIKTPQRDSGYAPSAEYNPTRVVVKCATCKSVGIAEFVNGFNLKEGDRLMAGKPIMGLCFRCNKETELIPLPASKERDREFRTLYDVQRSLDAMGERGMKIDQNGTIIPFGRLKAYDDWRAANGG